MASELRWILLGLGLALIAGLWWWERRRPTVAADDATIRTAGRFEPRLDGEAPAGEFGGVASPGIELPIRAVDDRPVPRGDPPLVTLDDLPENTDSVVLAVESLNEESPVSSAIAFAERRRVRPEPTIDVTTALPLEAAAELPRELAPAVRAAEDPASGTWVAPDMTTPPAVSSTTEVVATVTVEPPPPPVPAPDSRQSQPPSRLQRIVAIRLLGDPERRIGGAELQHALAVEGMEFGRYSIFHRMVKGGRPVFSAASLVEPGSFDQELMPSIRFPGISLFAVFPGPTPAPQGFDELLATARRLADRLGGVLQDDSGSSLTGQRVLSIREELVHFEHLVALGRSRPGA